MNKDTLNNSKAWFETAVPVPTLKHLDVQLGVHLEEVAEMLETITLQGLGDEEFSAGVQLQTVWQGLDMLAKALKAGKIGVGSVSGEKMLDAICDQIVTAVGVGHMLKMDVVGGTQEVNRSNWSKFVDGQPIWDSNGKVAKGPGYSKPDLLPFLQDAGLPKE